MNANDPASRPAVKPPATGADAWKNRRTDCWPTPASMHQAREVARPLDPSYGDSEQPAPEAQLEIQEDTWEGEGGTDADGEPSVADGDGEPQRATLADDPKMPGRFRDTVRRLDEVSERPVSEHAESYDAVHRDLRNALDDTERPS